MSSPNTAALAEVIKPGRPRRAHREGHEKYDDASQCLLALLAAGMPWRGIAVPARPVFIRECRVFARSALEAWHFPELVDSVELCTSELVTNAMCYGNGDFVGFGLILREDEVELEVFDHGVGEPFVNFAETNDEYGRGMTLVEDLSDDWGVDSMRSFVDMEQRWKRVWCNFRLPV